MNYWKNEFVQYENTDPISWSCGKNNLKNLKTNEHEDRFSFSHERTQRRYKSGITMCPAMLALFSSSSSVIRPALRAAYPMINPRFLELCTYDL